MVGANLFIVQRFSEQEPDPWSVPMPVPIIGYLLGCSGTSHCHEDVVHRLSSLTGSKSDLARLKSLSDTKLNKISK